MDAHGEKLTVVEHCPNCGGRVSTMRLDSGKVSATCMGTAGEEQPCGWATEESSTTVVPVKRTA